ncbi:TetR/AcrR family transcriptional regulator [Algisphaera agarilytica]|uniref:AcrR family transcriptional regulator n=1 Tax=Algisphaera agarilytica TaxID=1385975 RepID=A0A7X0LLK6_9BACT|nr:TetR family transcriptional regulator [Algisphaera agarilytica]MBB6431009.1 AcrR family transcriptional regulator [Algisphaera agarilytica]
MTESDPTWQRARSDEQRAQRREAILDAAAQLLDEGGVENAGLNAIARQAGLSKPTLYLYFESREAVLLELVLRDYDRWVEPTAKEIGALSPSDADAACLEIADRLAATLTAQPRLAQLLHSLASVLERNVSTETIITFKLTIHEATAPLLQAMADKLGIPTEAAMAIYWQWGIAVAGAWPHGHPSHPVAEALKDPRLAHMGIEFQTMIRDMAIALLRNGVRENSADT